MLNIDNVTITTGRPAITTSPMPIEPIEKKVPFNAMTKACAESLLEAESEANRILGLLDTTEKREDFPTPEVNDLRMALDLNIVLSRRIAETLTHIVTILEG